MNLKGLIDSCVLTIGTEWLELGWNWAKIDVYNDGDSDLYLRNDDLTGFPWEEGKAPLKKGDHLVMDGTKRNEYSNKPRFICKTGTAEIRVFRLL